MTGNKTQFDATSEAPDKGPPLHVGPNARQAVFILAI